MRLLVETIRVTLAAACAAVLLPAAADAACPLDSFADRKVDVCGSGKCTSFTPPVEIEAITRGVYGETIGLFINDGYAEWVGIDLDKSEIVEVQRYAGRELGAAPRASSDPNVTRRETRDGDRHWIDVVRRAPLAADAAGDIVCSANTVWAAPPSIVPPSLSITDMHQGVVLIDRGTRKASGGPGGMSRPAQALHAQLRKLLAAALPAR